MDFWGKVALPNGKPATKSGLYKNKTSNSMNRTNSINTSMKTDEYRMRQLK